jgi:hypothetical protein
MVFESCGVSVEAQQARFEDATIIATENPDDLRLLREGDRKLFFLMKTDTKPHRTDFPDRVFVCHVNQDETGITALRLWLQAHLTSVLE